MESGPGIPGRVDLNLDYWTGKKEHWFRKAGMGTRACLKIFSYLYCQNQLLYTVYMSLNMSIMI